jgi:hypothetical protein
MPTTWPYQMLTSPLRSRLERFHRGPGSPISPRNMTEPSNHIPSLVVLNKQPPPHGTRRKLNTTFSATRLVGDGRRTRRSS